jgi:ubiquitin-protein ligase
MIEGGRERRLRVEAARMAELSRRSSLIDVEPLGDTLDRYRVTFRCKGLFWQDGAAAPSTTARHVLEIYLHKDFPRRPPQLLWKTEIFHPNMLSPRRNGGVCIGSWSPAEGLDDLVVRIGEMVQMKRYGLIDPLDPAAAEWVKSYAGSFPLDDRPLAVGKPSVDADSLEWRT